MIPPKIQNGSIFSLDGRKRKESLETTRLKPATLSVRSSPRTKLGDALNSGCLASLGNPWSGEKTKADLLRFAVNDFPAHHFDGIKPIPGLPSQFPHMEARTFESLNGSPPKGGTIGEFFKQIVFSVHGRLLQNHGDSGLMQDHASPM
jgi:hypothetical protein